MPPSCHRARPIGRRRAAVVCSLLVAVAAACSPPEPAPPARAALVVDPGDGAVLTRCVEFAGPTASGIAVLERSGLPLAYDVSGSLGTLVCSIAGTGCDFPVVPCLCRCSGGEGCRFWSYWRQRPDGAWTEAPAGAGAATVAAGSVEGWRFGDGATPPPAARFEEICG